TRTRCLGTVSTRPTWLRPRTVAARTRSRRDACGGPHEPSDCRRSVPVAAHSGATRGEGASQVRRAKPHRRREEAAVAGNRAITGTASYRVQVADERVPAWRRATKGETRWPAAAVVIGTLALQLALPDEMVLHPWWLLPSLTA